MRPDIAAAVEDTLRTHPVGATPDQALRSARFDAGLAFTHFERGHGGLGSTPAEADEVDEAFEQAGSPSWLTRNGIGLGMAAPTIHAHGTPEQKERLLRPLFTGEEIWCQLFSEPGAGSDLAALATRAVRADDDSWVVSGQKVWTTLAHVARWGLLLTRTDPGAVKHRGLTYFVLDLQSPGVEIRPIRQLTGDAEFNEVFLDDVVVPAENMLGSVGDGWRIAMTTLMNERQSLGGRVLERGEGPIAQVVSAYRSAVADGRSDPSDLDRVVRLWTQAEAARLTNLRAADRARSGIPGPEGSIAKLQMAELNQAMYDAAMDLVGTDALLYSSYEFSQPEVASAHGDSGDLRYDYLRALANSIEGGTSEIQRNILGERVLGLPGEPRVDKDLPWNEVPRS